MPYSLLLSGNSQLSSIYFLNWGLKPTRAAPVRCRYSCVNPTGCPTTPSAFSICPTTKAGDAASSANIRARAAQGLFRQPFKKFDHKPADFGRTLLLRPMTHARQRHVHAQIGHNLGYVLVPVR